MSREKIRVVKYLMKRTNIISLLSVISIATLVIFGCNGKAKEQTKEPTPQVAENKTIGEKNQDIKENINLEFSSKTIMEKVIDNKVLKDYKLTMINFWATYCDPCKKELPDLQKIYEEEIKNGVNVLGVLVDIEGEKDDEHIQLAKKIVEKSGVKYENVIGEKNIGKYYAKLASGVPFTIFVDSSGKMVGKEINGSRSKEQLKKEIDERLKSLK